MAKDKEFEKQYKEIRLMSTKLRKERRKDAKRRRRRERQQGICPNCGGQMSWCDVCEMWSSDCCEEYGDCMCS